MKIYNKTEPQNNRGKLSPMSLLYKIQLLVSKKKELNCSLLLIP